MSEEYKDMTVAELKALLKEAGLPVSGNKSVLVARLSDNAEDDLVEETVVEEAAEESQDSEDDSVEETVVEEAAEESQDSEDDSEDDFEDLDDDEDWDDEETE